jgi:preprotein translocase subunit SecA
MSIFGKILEKIIGTKNERELRKLWPAVRKINEVGEEIAKLSNKELAKKTEEFKKRLEDGESLDDILVPAFAVVREVAKRTLGMTHFDVQLLGGIVLHQGKIAEMKTGEGKTLVATAPAYLNALLGRGVHIVTVNDYLAKRDALWMGPIYLFLDLTVGVIQHDASFLVEWEDRETFRTKLVPCSRRDAYLADITYGQNNEFGFDYLRDNMAWDISECVQRELYYAIVDEVDSILIDEARTPLIISGPAEESVELYRIVDMVVRGLKRGVHYEVDEERKQALLTDEGVNEIEKRLGIKNLYDPIHANLVHKITQALRAHAIFKRDVDYVVKDGEIVIVDEFTGRLMPGRRWSDGLHQAIEAKEGVPIRAENQTLATITFQNYFRMYEKLAGMTGTAETEAEEFLEIYGLEVVVIPTHKPMIRIDYPDVVFKTEKEKWEAVVKEIEELHKIGRPVLVGTTSIEKSEKLSQMLKKRGIKHNVLNAKYHEREAEIVAQAGRLYAVTIATNMAGRGTDIMLGGNPEFLAKDELRKKYGTLEGIPAEEWKATLEKWKKITEEERKKVVELGGLHIIGTERHEARRIDNQLRGRAGRQGDPGSSRFYLSLEDDLLRIFGGDKLKAFMEKIGMKEGEAIEHPWLTKAIENAQKKVEAYNFEIRKYLLEYDSVMNKQREVIYGLRRRILVGEDLREEIMAMAEDVMRDIVSEVFASGDPDYEKLLKKVKAIFGMNLELEEIRGKKKKELDEFLAGKLEEAYREKEGRIGREEMAKVERMVLLYYLDLLWKEHLHAMDYLREVVGLRGYGQKDPLHEYKRESFILFSEMLNNLKLKCVESLFKMEVRERDIGEVSEEEKVEVEDLKEERVVVATTSSSTRRKKYVEHRGDGRVKNEPVRVGKKIGRNDPCPCGSGKKYKYCCGRH